MAFFFVIIQLLANRLRVAVFMFAFQYTERYEFFA